MNEKLPSLPSVALEIVRLCKSDDVPLDELAKVVSMDPSLATKILRLANSAKYRRDQELTDVDRACFVLGLKTLKIMALGFSVAGSTKFSEGITCFDYDAFWAYSISCAVAAREIAKARNSEFENEAFISGLLSRMGQLAMAKAIPDEYKAVAEQSESLLPQASLEMDVLGVHHHEISEHLLSQWELPELLVSVVRYWEEPEQLQETEEICKYVRLADCIAHLIHDKDKGHRLKRAYEWAREDFGMTEDDLDQFVIILNEEINSLARILDVKIETKSEFQQLVDDAREQMVQVSLQAAMELETTSVDLENERERSSELASKSEELLRKSQIDALTEIPNRGAFDDKLRKTVALRIAEPTLNGFGILMLDVDHFKSFNDNYGHLTGDKVLKRVATTLQKALRPNDFLARYGGEEFIILFNDAGLDELRSIAERTRRLIEAIEFQFEGKNLRVTASFGGAVGRAFNEISDGMELVKLADECLYESKNNGRNRVTVSSFELARSH